MNVWWILRTEFRRLIRSRIGRAAVIVGMIIPLLYSGLYLYAFWDPYENMSEFPVALVNLDQGAMQGEKKVAYGDDLVRKLLEDGDFKWQTVGADEARRGMEENRYYLLVTIPETFSSDVLSVEGDHPKRAEVLFQMNEGKNYIASTISSRLEATLREELGNQFSKEYLKGIFDVIGDAGNGLSKAADGANQLADGSGQVADGVRDVNDAAQKLADGAAQTAKGSNDLVGGTRDLASGSAQLAAGAGQFAGSLDKASGGANDLAAGADKIAAGNQGIADNLAQSTNGVKQVRDRLSASLPNSDQLQGGLVQMQSTLGTPGAASVSPDPAQMSALDLLGGLASRYNGLAQDPYYQIAVQKIGGVSTTLGSTAQQVGASKQGLTQAVGALNEIAAGQDRMVAGAKELAGGGQALSAGATSLQQGLGDLRAGGAKLAQSSQQIADGASKIASGQEQLNGGVQQVADGNRQLAGSTPKLLDGSRDVAEGNRTLADELTRATAESTISNPDAKAEIMADPLATRSEAVHPVGTYGMGFAAYFIPLSLWVGALMLYFILSLREYRWILTPVSTTSLVLGKFLTLGVIGVCQALISSTVLVFVLGLQVQHLPEFYLFNILFSLTAISIIGFLIARFGTGAGRFISIVLLILQLTSSAGTFPLELLPRFFQAIHPYLPMTYAIEGLREIIAIGDQTAVWRDITVLGLLLLAVLVLHIVTTRRTLRVRDLHGRDELAG